MAFTGPGIVPTDPLFGASSNLADLLVTELSAGAPSPYTLGPAQRAMPFLDQPRAPFLPEVGSNTRSLIKDYTSPEFRAFLKSLRPDVADSLLRYELGKVARGSDPLTDKERVKAATAAQTGEAVTSTPDRNPLNVPVNIYKDLTDIVASVPKIPGALIEEVRDLPKIPERIAEAQASGANIVEAVAQAPGVRMLPGAYTVGNLAGGGEGINEAVTHPLMTFLDVLPAAKAAGLGEKIGATALGSRASATKQALGAELRSTRVGQLAQSLWGTQSRTMSVHANTISHQVRMALDPKFDLSITQHLDDGIAKEATGWAQRWQDQVTPERARELTDIAQDPRWVEQITDPAEMQMLRDYSDIMERVSQQAVDTGLLAQVELGGVMEYVTPAQAQKITTRRVKLDTMRRFAQVRGLIGSSPDAATLAQVWTEQVRPFVLNDGVKIAERDRLLRGLRTAMQDAGYRAPKVTKLTGKNVQAMIDQFDNWTGDPLPRELTAQQLRARDKWLIETSKMTPARAERFASQVAEREASFTPGRWKSFVDEQVRQRAKGVEAVATDLPPELVESYLANGRWSEMVRAGLIDPKELSTWVREANETMNELRAAGHEPLFVHRVRPGAAHSINNPAPLRGLDQKRMGNPSQVKERAFDSGAYVHDLGVSLSHQALEWVNRRAATTFLRDFLRTTPLEGETVAPFARSYDDLVRQYAGVGRARQGLDPFADPVEAINRRIGKEWVRFDPKQLPADVRAELGFTKNFPEADLPYVPKPLMKNLEWLIKPPDLGKVVDVPMTAFRTSVVALSPRAQVNNVVGGFIMLQARTGPGIWTKFQPAFEMMRRIHAGEAVDDISATFRNTFGSTARELLDMNDQSRIQFAAGSKMAELWSQFEDSKPRKAGRALVEKSLGLNAFFDDLYRTTAYLYEYDKALTKGMTREAAQAAGETLARKTLMSWDSMTPFERTIMRSIFPFYNFAGHLIRYVYRYPADHPLRAAVISTIARNELEDLGTGLPQTFLNSFFLGDPDERGHVTVANIGGMNPFRDAATYMTLAGFLSGVNPIFQTVLNLAGVEPSRPGTNLYPNLRYDPETGRLSEASPNPLTTLLTNTIPQAGVLTGLLDRSSEMQELFRFDPATGMRFLATTAGVPILWRDLEVNQEQFKAELRRDEAMQRVLSDALRSGDWTTAAQYEQLRPVLGQVDALQAQSGARYARLNPTTIEQMQNLILGRVAS